MRTHWLYQGVLVHFINVLVVTEAVYFGQQRYRFCLSTPLGGTTLIGRVFAFVNSHDRCSKKELLFDVAYPISVNSSGWVSLETNNPSDLPDSIIRNITARCPTGDPGSTVLTSIEIYLEPAVVSATTTYPNMTTTRIEDMCFYGAPDNLFIEENTADQPVLGTVNSCRHIPGTTALYSTSKPNKFTIDPVTMAITLLKPLDREKLTSRDNNSVMSNIHGIQSFKLSCVLTRDAVSYGPVERRVNVTVINVNDNVPIFHDHNNVRHIYKDVQVESGKNNLLLEEVIIDEDNNSLVLAVTNDPLRVCRADLFCLHPKLTGKAVCRLNVSLESLQTISGTLYRCTIAVTDDTHVSRREEGTGNTSLTITVNIHKNQVGMAAVEQLTDHATFTFYRNATRLARLTQLRNDTDGRPIRFTLEDNGVFSITPLDGIIYVDTVEGLARMDDTLALNVHMSGGTASVTILVNLIGKSRNLSGCDGSCSSSGTAPDCMSSCGLGIGAGNCVMRGSGTSKMMSAEYGTCTYNDVTCPDLKCDELENQYPMLCPQDCVSKDNIVGAAIGNTFRGIKMAMGTCSCDPVDYDYHDSHEYSTDDMSMECSCVPPPPREEKEKDSNERLTTTTANKKRLSGDLVTSSAVSVHGLVDIGADTSTTQYNRTDKSHILALATEESRTTCDNACLTAIGLGLGAFFTISFTLFMLWFTKKRNDRRKSNMKHVGSVVSMSAVPSDYVEERERRMSYSSPQWSPKRPMYTTYLQSLQNENSKWEIPREKLKLAKTLGEGEFGVVVKARAAGLGGDNTTEIDVAVKMLKHCSSQLEEQDLWSEFNLLKDVSHPNVIRLLGACTEDGPFYVIVEYCEHGCLLNYLRRSRLEENGYVNSRMRFKSPNPKEQTDPDLEGNLLSTRDLLSFAWQISKGMGYLSEIKLVHRDLAARNVLVAMGNVLKISDFGLTRDVYEADTYLKKSRGRIPVKWLAPESLYAQIYTTRSDVWSYGIVLWEIATLGAPPYPGIPPERLYNLLIGGYRMDRPENCPDEMYAVMQKCWKIDAAERPSFQSLASIFDRILQEKTGYLDLNQPCGPDLYRKCFSPGIQGASSNGAASVPAESVSKHETVVDIVTPKTEQAPHTVCNETYTDTYLVPTPSVRIESPSYLDVNVETKPDTVPSSESSGSPLFKRKLSGKSDHLPVKTGKNKHVIFPSEKLSLLMENGTARFSNVCDTIDDTITVEEC